MEESELTLIANELSSQQDVEKVYCLQYTNDDIDYLKLLILLSDSSERTNKELIPFVKMALVNKPEFSFEIYRLSEVKAAIKNGNLYFFISCSNDNLLYERNNIGDIANINVDTIKGWKNSMIDRFNAWSNKTNSFLVGADFYQKKEDYNLSTFMLHQALELTYRALISALLIKEKKSHDIGELQDYVHSFLPQLGKLFKKELPEDCVILKKLNKAYSSVRYQQNHLVDQNIVPVIFQRLETLQVISKWVIDEISENLDLEYQKALEKKRHIGFDNNLKNHTGADHNDGDFQFHLHSEKLGDALNKIIDALSPDYIYVFGNKIIHNIECNLFLKQDEHNSYLHYDLLVITPKANSQSANIGKSIEKLQNITINILVHSRQEVLNKIEKGNRFFNTVIKDGQIAYKRSDIDELKYNDSARLPSNSVYYSAARINRSLALLKSANFLALEEPNTSAMLLALSLEQALLGIIHIYMGYIPNINSLSHLIKICKIFWPNQTPFFLEDSEVDIQTLNILSRSVTEVRYHVAPPLDIETFTVISSRSNSLIGSAIQISQYELVKKVKLLNV